MLEDGAAGAERNLVAAAKAELVRFQRDALRHAMQYQLTEAVERLTHRTVRAFLSGTSEDGEHSIEAFLPERETTLIAAANPG